MEQKLGQELGLSTYNHMDDKPAGQPPYDIEKTLLGDGVHMLPASPGWLPVRTSDRGRRILVKSKRGSHSVPRPHSELHRALDRAVIHIGRPGPCPATT